MKEQPPLWRLLLPVVVSAVIVFALLIGGTIHYTTNITYL